MTLQQAPVVDFSDVVATLAEAYAVVADDAGKSLEVQVAPRQCVHGDVALLRQILANLMDHALVRSGQTLRACPVREVADDGPGVPPEERARVLRRFYLLDRSRGTPGSGLGLALVAAVAKPHGTAPVMSDAAPGLCVSVDFLLGQWRRLSPQVQNRNSVYAMRIPPPPLRLFLSLIG